MINVFLLPGELAAIAEPGRIATILGSCVAVVLFDKRRGIVGMCHFLLSEPRDDQAEADSARYGSVALPALYKECIRLGSVNHDLDAMLFGGASVVESLRSFDGSIGEKNVETARLFLSTHRIAIVKEDVGGKKGRKIAITAPTCVVTHEVNT